MGENLLQASFLASLVHRVYNPLQKVFLCVIQTNSVFPFTQLVHCWDKPGLMTASPQVMISGKATAKRVRGGRPVWGRSSDFQARRTGQWGAGVAWQLAQPATYPRVDTSDTAGRKG